MAPSTLSPAEISHDVWILLMKVARRSVLNFFHKRIIHTAQQFKVNDRLGTEEFQPRVTSLENVPISQWGSWLCFLAGMDASPRIPIPTACPSKLLLPSWIWKTESRKRPFGSHVSGSTTQVAQRIVFKSYEVCVHLTDISQWSAVPLARGQAWQFLGWLRQAWLLPSRSLWSSE